ncbi:MAG: thioredoxin domain-containing protein [Flavobacteriales bacterium]|nr:thioredoxin domain-containing protein [Flavobacteriales bacterium]
MHAHTNRLADESSPYLLQHAHNPVDWYPWGEEAFAKARAENKLVLVSVGYSSCHWCHVMERECFENDSIAALMNEHYVCIKVDREERPDVDQVYMTAVQLMTQRGGWPLNCFTLPDGRPVYGGTYFPPQQWTQVLQDLHTTWTKDPGKVRTYAERLHQGVLGAELVHVNEEPPAFTRRDLDELVAAWDSTFDNDHGGPDRAPKFPMPNNYQFLLKQAWITDDAALRRHVELTLDKMALGGIRDQVGGGFARYSVDVLWKVPHFEKMLYDNAQLISLYSQAYQAFHHEEYRRVVESTIAFLEREMRSEEGAFYSALDADSEGEEGLFYVWTKAELEQVLGPDAALAIDYYNVGGKGLWEHDRNILLRTKDDVRFARERGLNDVELRRSIDSINAKLLAARAKRVRPGLDDKSLTSWNALMVQGYCDAHEVFGRAEWLAQARRTMELILTKCRRPDGGLWHSYKAGKASINGYLEDYSFTIEALLALYGVTFEERWLQEARKLADHAIAHFHTEGEALFHFTSDQDPPLIARKAEVTDNVIPASNSSMAKGLFQLGHLFDDARYIKLATGMLNNVKPQMRSYPAGYSNWAQLMLMHVHPLYEIAITGPEALARRAGFAGHYIPNRMFLGTPGTSALPLLEGKSTGATTIYVCVEKSCRMPVGTVNEAIGQLR